MYTYVNLYIVRRAGGSGGGRARATQFTVNRTIHIYKYMYTHSLGYTCVCAVHVRGLAGAAPLIMCNIYIQKCVHINIYIGLTLNLYIYM